MNDAITTKIKKLLAQANDKSVTAAEAELFMAKATKLITENNLSLETVFAEKLQYSEEELFTTGRWLYGHQKAAKLAEQFCFCEYFVGLYKEAGKNQVTSLMVFGSKENVEYFRFMWYGLVDAFDNLFKQYRSRTRCELSAKNTFIAGVYDGFRDKMLASQREACQDRDRDISSANTALLNHPGSSIILASVAEKVREAFNQIHPDIHTVPSKHSLGNGDSHARSAGYVAGQKLNINRSIK